MAELYFDGIGMRVTGPDIEVNECCPDGRNAYLALENAELVSEDSDFGEDITDEVLDDLDERCAAAETCTRSTTGICALQATGLLAPRFEQ